MKRRTLFLFTFLLSHSTSVWAMDLEELETSNDRPTISLTASLPEEQTYSREEAQRLQYLLLRADQAIQGLELSGPKVFLLGKSGSGKSTLFNFLIGKDLHVDAEGRLDTTDPVSSIGHGINSMTSFPILGQGPDNMVFCDFPGFGDSGGPEEDLKHAYMRHKLLTGQFKILLAVDEPSLTSRADDFLNVIHALTQEIPLEHLKSSLAIVVTKQGIVRFSNPHQKLRSMLGATRTYALNEDVEELLRYLTDEDRIHSRVPFFPCPHNIECEYDSQGSKDTILDTIRSLEAMVNPKVRLHLSPHSENLIEGLAKRLNEDITQSLQNVVRPKILHLCQQQTNAYASQDNMVKLEMNLRAIQQALSLLAEDSADHMVTFLDPLEEFFDQNDSLVKKYVKTLLFLKTLKQDVPYSNAIWAHTLQAILQDIHELMDVLAKKLFQKITSSLEIVNDSIRCNALPESSSGEYDIEKLQDRLETINTVVETLQADISENSIHFAEPLKRFFSKSDSKAIRKSMKTLGFLKTLTKIDYPLGTWIGTFTLSIDHLKGAINTQQKITILKERVEDERSRAEEREKAYREEIGQKDSALKQSQEQANHKDEAAQQATIAAQQIIAQQAATIATQQATAIAAQKIIDQQATTIAAQQLIAQQAATIAAQQAAQQLAAQSAAPAAAQPVAAPRTRVVMYKGRQITIPLRVRYRR